MRHARRIRQKSIGSVTGLLQPCGGMLQVAAPTLTSNRVCAATSECAFDQYIFKPATASSTVECRARTRCEYGHYVTELGTPSSDRVCGPCKAGTYQRLFNNKGGVNTCVPCGEGTTDHDNNPATECQVNVPECPAGQYVTVDAGAALPALLGLKAVTTTLCVACPAGSVAEAGPMTMCWVCQKPRVPNASKSRCVMGDVKSTGAASASLSRMGIGLAAALGGGVLVGCNIS